MVKPLKFCNECGTALQAGSFQGRGEALICPQGHLNLPPGPKILVASFIHCGPRLLWMKRKVEPRKGCWAIPAGFMESGETLVEAASRELYEETQLRVPTEQLLPYMIGSISYISEVYISFRAGVADTACAPGLESLDVGFFSREELPWELVAFPSANNAIRQAYSDCEDRLFGVYHGSFTSDTAQLTLINPRLPECWPSP